MLLAARAAVQEDLFNEVRRGRTRPQVRRKDSGKRLSEESRISFHRWWDRLDADGEIVVVEREQDL